MPYKTFEADEVKMKDKSYVILDIETTGFSAAHHKITEIGAVKIKDGVIIDKFHSLIDPGVSIPWRITEITGITDDLLVGQPTIGETLPLFFDFCSDCTIVAHNIRFDMGFIKYNAAELGLECEYSYLDTLAMARKLFPGLENHKLNTVATHLNIDHQNHHRAMGDAKATAEIFLHCLNLLE